MRLGLNIGYSGPRLSVDMERVHHAELLGFDSVWTAEAYGSDAITPLTWIAAQTTKIKLGTAILQISARAPAMTAMTAMSLDQLSGGRLLLGLGPSGPQVVEGWLGQPYGKPLTRTRETIDILRKVFRREAPLVHEGPHYQIPFRGEGSTGLGKPLKSILHGRADIPILTAAISPRGIACSGEVADGLIPVWLDPERMDLVLPHLEEGFAKAGSGKDLEGFRIAPFVGAVLGEDLERCRAPMKGMLALYIGGMGARGKNFYNDYACRLGYEQEAMRIQDLYLDGKKAEAAAAVPDRLVDEVSLVGPRERIIERLEAWKASPVTDMVISSGQPELLELLAEQLL